MSNDIDKNRESIDLRIRQQDLIELIKTRASLCIEYQQVSKRLKELIDLKYEKIKESLENTHEVSKSQLSRKAFLEEEYINILERYLNIKNEYIKSKVIYDTYMMLFEARRTKESYLKELRSNL